MKHIQFRRIIMIKWYAKVKEMLILTLFLKTIDSNKTKLNNLKMYTFFTRFEAMKQN